MTKLKLSMNSITDFISEFWRIATTKHHQYEYVIEDIELQERNNVLHSLIYYRAIGSRTTMCGSASELSASDVFSKFQHAQAQAIVILSTLEKMMQLDKEALILNYKEYIEQCAKAFRLQRKK